VLVGIVPASAVDASLPIILAATAIGQLVIALWSASLGQNDGRLAARAGTVRAARYLPIRMG
jgi:hypothetical protein